VVHGINAVDGGLRGEGERKEGRKRVRLELAGGGKELLRETLPNKVKVLRGVAAMERKVSSVAQERREEEATTYT
jgi:hypothetical protein